MRVQGSWASFSRSGPKAGIARPSGRQGNGVVAGGRSEHDHDDELKRRIAEVGHVLIVVVAA
jgi:hypothetical protein